MHCSEVFLFCGDRMRNQEIIKLYKSPMWYKEIRSEQLKADRFECQRCKHKGKYSNVSGMVKYTRATLVHHEFRVQDYPQYVYSRFVDGVRNTYSLCNDCHEIEHEEERGLVKKAKPFNEERW